MDFFGELDGPLVLGFVNVTRGDNNKNVTLNLGLGLQAGWMAVTSR